MRIVTLHARHHDTRGGPAGRALAMRAGGPILYLVRMALGAHPTAVIEVDGCALQPAKLTVGAVARRAGHDRSRRVLQLDVPVRALRGAGGPVHLLEGHRMIYGARIFLDGRRAGDDEEALAGEVRDLDALHVSEVGLGA